MVARGKERGYLTYDELNAALQRSMAKKKERRQKRRLKENPWTYLAVVLILTLCILAWVVIRKVLHP